LRLLLRVINADQQIHVIKLPIFNQPAISVNKRLIDFVYCWAPCVLNLNLILILEKLPQKVISKMFKDVDCKPIVIAHKNTKQ
jgi:hypothetical protein